MIYERSTDIDITKWEQKVVKFCVSKKKSQVMRFIEFNTLMNSDVLEINSVYKFAGVFKDFRFFEFLLLYVVSKCLDSFAEKLRTSNDVKFVAFTRNLINTVF